MGADIGIAAVIVIIIVILAAAVIGTVLYFKFRNRSINSGYQTTSEGFSHGFGKGKGIKYTEKDRDLMELLNELSVTYDNTDQYLNR